MLADANTADALLFASLLLLLLAIEAKLTLAMPDDLVKFSFALRMEPLRCRLCECELPTA